MSCLKPQLRLNYAPELFRPTHGLKLGTRADNMRDMIAPELFRPTHGLKQFGRCFPLLEALRLLSYSDQHTD